MRCDHCNHGSFTCRKCGQMYSFLAADKQVDLRKGQTILVTWEDKGLPVKQIEISEEKVDAFEWTTQMRQQAEEHIQEIYESLEYNADNDDHNVLERIHRLRTDAERAVHAESIMQDLIDYLSERHRVGENAAEQQFQQVVTKVRQHLGMLV